MGSFKKILRFFLINGLFILFLSIQGFVFLHNGKINYYPINRALFCLIEGNECVRIDSIRFKNGETLPFYLNYNSSSYLDCSQIPNLKKNLNPNVKSYYDIERSKLSNYRYYVSISKLYNHKLNDFDFHISYTDTTRSPEIYTAYFKWKSDTLILIDRQVFSH